MIEKRFDTVCVHCWCNLFKSGDQHIEWHQDKYGNDCFVLSLGATRPVDWCDLDESNFWRMVVKHGDLYYFNQEWDSTHQHSVPRDADCKEYRYSFVVFTTPPYSGRRTT